MTTFGETNGPDPDPPRQNGSSGEFKSDRYRLILDSALDAIVAIDEKGLIVDWNKRAEALFGWSEAEAVGRRMAELIIPVHQRSLHHVGFHRFLATGHGPILDRRVETSAVDRLGMEFPVELTVSAARLGDGWMFTAFLRDLRSQKAAENRSFLQQECVRILALSSDWRRALDALIQAILERTAWETGALWKMDTASGKLVCGSLAALPAFPLQEWQSERKEAAFPPGVGLVGRVWSSRRPFWARNRLEDRELEEERSEAPDDLLAYFAFPIILDGRTVAVLEFFSRGPLDEDPFLRDALVSIGGQVGQFLERCQAEESLLEDRERLGLVFDNTNDEIALFAVEGPEVFHCVEANPRYLAATGLAKDAVVDRRADEFLPAAAFSAWKEKAQELVASQTRLHFESESPGPKRKRNLEQTWQIIPKRGSRAMHILVIARDVTEARIQEEALRQSQKMEAIGRLAGGIAHDFNNLLTVINGYGELGLARMESGDPMHGILQEIKNAGLRAARLTSQLLAFSRRQILAPTVLKLNEVVSEMLSMLRRLISENFRLTIALDPDLRPVRVDPGQIEQVVLNLVLNARDAMPEGGCLTLETANAFLDQTYVDSHPEASPGPHVLLAVGDTGVGMTPEIKERLFEPFFTTKPRGKGTGMGLATVFGIVKQSGGSIHVYSEPGHGSVFKVYFPAVQELPGMAGNPSAAKESGGLGKGETLLLAEDEDSVRNLIADALRQKGYRVLPAANAEQAEDIASRESGPIHLLITDVVMPGGGGRSLAERIGRKHPESRILFMSGYTDNAITHNGELDPGAVFLQKPFSMEALANKVRAVLDSP